MSCRGYVYQVIEPFRNVLCLFTDTKTCKLCFIKGVTHGVTKLLKISSFIIRQAVFCHHDKKAIVTVRAAGMSTVLTPKDIPVSFGM